MLAARHPREGLSAEQYKWAFLGPTSSPGFAPPPSSGASGPPESSGQPGVAQMHTIGAASGQIPPNLPLTVDPLLATGNPAVPLARRNLGDLFDQRLKVGWWNFVTTVDSKFVFAAGYPDHSFRVIDTDSGMCGEDFFKVRKPPIHVLYIHLDLKRKLADWWKN